MCAELSECVLGIALPVIRSAARRERGTEGGSGDPQQCRMHSHVRSCCCQHPRLSNTAPADTRCLPSTHPCRDALPSATSPTGHCVPRCSPVQTPEPKPAAHPEATAAAPPRLCEPSWWHTRCSPAAGGTTVSHRRRAAARSTLDGGIARPPPSWRDAGCLC
jgi:hypothetical protein